MRKWIIALAALLVVPAVGAAVPIVAPPEPEQLVEGHTVFTVIEVVRAADTNVEAFHAAVAVLVREVEQRADYFRFPGVLWFNDQYLVNPDSVVDKEVAIRYPCTGAVLAVEAGEADPRGAVDAYEKSYHITDPNDNVWDVDVWIVDATLPTEHRVWTVALQNNQAGYAVPDDGTSNCAAKTDNPCGGPTVLPVANDQLTPVYYDNGQAEGRVDNLCVGAVSPGFRDPGDNGRGYPCGLGTETDPYTGSVYDSANCPNLRYNAVLYFDLADLTPSGDIKNHEDGSADRAADVSGCHPTYGYYFDGYGAPAFWPCPAGDDDREGNSHSYNPENPWPLTVYDGRGNHGGSAIGCGTDQTNAVGYYTGEYNCHATSNIDIYFGEHLPPILRTYDVFDTEGSTAPYHCHDTMTTCNEDEVL